MIFRTYRFALTVALATLLLLAGVPWRPQPAKAQQAHDPQLTAPQPAGMQQAQDPQLAVPQPPPALPAATPVTDEQYLKKGIELYKAGRYREAVSQFGLALPREFSNAVLHYYLANTFINLNQNEAAIREFRIAYALAPRREAGQMSRKALSYLGADNFDDGIEKVVEKPSSKKEEKALEAVDPVFAKTLEMLKRQAVNSPSLSNATSVEKEISNRIDETIKKNKAAMADALERANPDDLKVPKEVRDQLTQIKLLNDAKYKILGRMSKMGDSVRDSADSLQALLKEKNSRSAPRLVPHGTNLYIRNYKAPGSPAAEPTAENAGVGNAGASKANNTGTNNVRADSTMPAFSGKEEKANVSTVSSKASSKANHRSTAQSKEKPKKLWGVTLRE